MEELNSISAKLAVFFHESPTSMPTEDLLATFADFSLALERAINDNERQKALRAQEKKLAERKAQRKADQEANKDRPARPASSRRGLLDNIGKTLRKGGGTTYQTMRKGHLSEPPAADEE
jgi:hypothetical protein